MGLIQEILASMERLDNSGGASVEAREVRSWMSSDQIEDLGAVYSFIMDDRYCRKIEPPLGVNDYKDFLLRYYGRCFRENPRSSWADSRYSAGWDLSNWINGLWKEGYRDIVVDVRDWLADLYKDADAELRTCIVNATLEHVLDNPAIATAFKTWKSDPVLRPAYLAALDPRAAL